MYALSVVADINVYVQSTVLCHQVKHCGYIYIDSHTIDVYSCIII